MRSTPRENIVSSAGLIRTFIAEFRRRQVLRVIALYAIGAWLVLQIAEVTFEPLGFPPWAMRTLILTAIAGFPLAFILAWIIDLTPQGLIFDLPLWQRPTAEQRSGDKNTDVAIVVVLTAIIGIGVYSIFAQLVSDDAVQPDGATQAPAAAPAQTPEALPDVQDSIAVMAFASLGADAQTGYFASGLAEEILSMLSALPELNVAARSSSFRFAGQDIDVREVANLLGVRHILDGSVRQGGDSIRVAAHLVDGTTGFQVWTRTYDRKLENAIAIQQEIAAAVANELEITLSASSSERLQRRPTENIDAYLFYLQGRERLRQSTDVDVLATAGQLFRQALEIDPEFARAYAGVCETHLALYESGRSTADFEQAEQACGKADLLEDGRNFEIYVALGRLYRYNGRYDLARQKLEQALELSPVAVDAYIELGDIYLAEGKHALAEASYMRAVDLKRGYWKAHAALGNLYFHTERYADAVESYRTVTRLMPDSATGFAGLGAAHWMLDNGDLARDAWNKSLKLKPTRQAYTNLGLRYYYAGLFEDAAAMQESALTLAPDDHRVWGRLAEARRFIPGAERQALDAYTRAAALAEESIAINPSDWKSTGLLAIYYAHLDRLQEAREFARRAVGLSQRNAEALYYQALVLLEGGDADGALDALAEAVAADESYRKFLTSDPDMQVLRDEQRFRALLESSGTGGSD